MRPKISWSDLAGARVGLWGIGVEGRANLRRLQAMDTGAVVVDDYVEAGPEGVEILTTGGGGLDALLACDVVVKSPGLSRYRPEVGQLEEAGIPVTGGLGLWLQEAPLDRVACITGTKGKSTTASIAGHLLDRLGYRALVAGNIGRAPWDPEVGSDFDLWVIETSSFQATDVAVSPSVVAVTSLHPDHLDWHGDTETYFNDKLSLCSQPGAGLTMADGDSPLLRSRADQLGPRVEWVEGPGDPSMTRWVEGLGLLGAHNARNALIAQAVLIGLGVAEAGDAGALSRAAGGFAPLASRLRRVSTLAAVDFVDDSLSTNVLPTLAALDTFATRRVALLVGGHDRGIDYRPLAEGLSTRAQETLVITMPDNGGRIGAELIRSAGARVEIEGPLELEAAVVRAYRWARPDGVVLLSPAAPSFGRFSDYRARSAAFLSAVEGLGQLGQ